MDILPLAGTDTAMVTCISEKEKGTTEATIVAFNILPLKINWILSKKANHPRAISKYCVQIYFQINLIYLQFKTPLFHGNPKISLSEN